MHFHVQFASIILQYSRCCYVVDKELLKVIFAVIYVAMMLFLDVKLLLTVSVKSCHFTLTKFAYFDIVQCFVTICIVKGAI